MSLTNQANAELIVRIAAKGDGVTGDGRYVALSAPGDRLDQDGGLIRGPHYVDPPCEHFLQCGGCDLQHLDAESYAQFVLERIVNALEGQEVNPGEVLEPQISPPKSRIRASMRAGRVGKSVKLGFSGAGSHRIIDLDQCEVLHPKVFSLVPPLRVFLADKAPHKHDMNLDMTLADQGVDLGIKGYEPKSLEEREALSEFAKTNDLARLSLDYGYGPETQWEPEPVSVTLGGLPVALPHSSFLQPTEDGKLALTSAMRETVGDAKLVADLFAGLGTFALALGPDKKVYAAEGSRDAIGALKMAANAHGRPVFTEHRDLYRRPLSTDELNRFEAIILDPPRAGARDQIAQIAKSDVHRVCYISCNPSSFARDAKTLCETGYRLDRIWPVGQFLWSTHVELAASFVR